MTEWHPENMILGQCGQCGNPLVAHSVTNYRKSDGSFTGAGIAAQCRSKTGKFVHGILVLAPAEFQDAVTGEALTVTATAPNPEGGS